MLLNGRIGERVDSGAQMVIIGMKMGWWQKVFSHQDIKDCQNAYGFHLLTDSR